MNVLSFQLEDVTVALEGERSKFAALDKKQRKFDQSFAEEKAISERLACSEMNRNCIYFSGYM